MDKRAICPNCKKHMSPYQSFKLYGVMICEPCYSKAKEIKVSPKNMIIKW